MSAFFFVCHGFHSKTSPAIVLLLSCYYCAVVFCIAFVASFHFILSIV